ncbi:MAG: PAS domain S-box protein [Nitrospinae bacterium]|nr:PAS domain S-box protein [Nitrospinota bacterium]MBF0633921.1 PAS domain S-box protein [Nitrospinota bacterium]
MNKLNIVGAGWESANDSLEQIPIILDGLEAGVYVFDVKSNKILLQNRAAYNFFGNLIGKHCWEVFHPEQKSPCKICSLEANHTLSGGEPETLVWEFKNEKDGRWYQIYERPAKWIEGKAVRISTSFDITGRKKAETELRIAKEQAEAATALKDEFVSLVAHDLRSPFASINGMLRILESDEENPLNERQRGLLQRALSSGERLLVMIEKLLNLSRLQTGSIVPKKAFFEARLAVATAVADLAHLAKEKGVKITYDIPADMRLYADYDLFIEVIVNLLSNAIKFCRKGDSVSIYVDAARPGVIAVRDTGVGISQKAIPNLFKSEVLTTTRGTAGEVGTGLGLPFCYDIIKANGGNLEVESKLGEGTVFYVVLPLALPKAMILEDSEDIRRELGSALTSIGALVKTGGAQETYAELKKGDIHLLLIGPTLGINQAGQIVSELKNDPDTSNIPIIKLVHNGDTDTRKKALSLGVNDVVSFPSSGETLSVVFRKYFD